MSGDVLLSAEVFPDPGAGNSTGASQLGEALQLLEIPKGSGDDRRSPDHYAVDRSPPVSSLCLDQSEAVKLPGAHVPQVLPGPAPMVAPGSTLRNVPHSEKRAAPYIDHIDDQPVVVMQELHDDDREPTPRMPLSVDDLIR